jgi:histidyl-tRNA synthetase
MEPIPNEPNKINTFPPSGMRDFLPAQMRKQKWLFDKWHTASKLFGYEQYFTPVVEHASLYTRKGGDDILKEMFSVKAGEIQEGEDPEETKLVLTPEGTPSLARLALENYDRAPCKPLRWYSFPWCFRNETVSRGRKREHFQWNIDCVGGKGIKYDLEMFQVIVAFFQEIGLKPSDVTIRYSNRQILQTILNQLSIPDELFEDSCNIIDKIKKLTPEDFRSKLMREVGMSSDGVDTIIKLANVTNVDDLQLFLNPNDPTLLEVQKLSDLAKKIGIDEWIEFNASIVRGLSYYTGLVFEGFFKNSEIKRSICGGGRYDNLFQTYGHKEKVPCVGFGFGDVVVMEVLEELGLMPQFRQEVDYVVIPFNDDLYSVACNISNQLRQKGRNIITYLEEGKRTLAFTYADRVGTSICIFIAPDEWAKNQVVIKYLRETDLSKKQVTVDVDKLEKFLDSI